jgi:hypothetical protein
VLRYEHLPAELSGDCQFQPAADFQSRYVLTNTAASDQGYRACKRRKGKEKATGSITVLTSSYDLVRGGGAEKGAVDALLASHTARLFPNLPELLLAPSSPTVLLLLEAPSCMTTTALLRVMPGLRAAGRSICIPQADPAHYAQMITSPPPPTTTSAAASAGGGSSSAGCSALPTPTPAQASTPAPNVGVDGRGGLAPPLAAPLAPTLASPRTPTDRGPCSQMLLNVQCSFLNRNLHSRCHWFPCLPA